MKPSRPFIMMDHEIRAGANLIEASAGTGKTYSLTGLFVRLLAEGKASSIDRILAITFTNAATDEMITRIRSRLREALSVFEGGYTKDQEILALRDRCGQGAAARLRDALRDFDKVCISTIHSFCKRMLEMNAFESGIPLLTDFAGDESAMTAQAAMDFWRRNVYVSDLMASFAAADDFIGLPKLMKWFGEWRNHPGARLVPEKANMPAWILKSESLLKKLRAEWNLEKIREILSHMTWNKGAVFGDNRRDIVLETVNAFFREDGEVQLWMLRDFTTARIEKWMNKNKCKVVPDNGFIKTCDEVFGALNRFSPDFYASFMREGRDSVENEKKRRHVLTFSDLLVLLHDALFDTDRRDLLARRIREQFDAVLVDEFQDTDAIQYGIIERAFLRDMDKDHPAPPVFLIGDPKQSIYGFRGADVFSYKKAREGPVVSTLSENWRSEPGLLEAVNAVFRKRGSAPFVFEWIPFEDMTPAKKDKREILSGDDLKPLVWWFVPPPPEEEEEDKKGKKKILSKAEGARQVLAATAREIVRLLSEGNVRIGEDRLEPHDFAVLVRTNKQAIQAQEALRKAGIPAVVGNSGDIVESSEMGEIQRILAAIAEPRDRRAVLSAIATDTWGLDADGIREASEDEARWQEIVDRLHRLRRTLARSGVMRALFDLAKVLDLRSRMLSLEDGPRRLTNFLHAAEYLHATAEELHLSLSGLVGWILQAREAAEGDDAPPSPSGGDPERAELRLETDAEAVQISTVHKAKGLEWNVVFCPFLWDAYPHDPESPALVHEGGEVIFDLGSESKPDRDEARDKERLAEDVRSAYVALTRARHRCYVAWGPIGKDSYLVSPLHYLLVDGGEKPERTSPVGDSGQGPDPSPEMHPLEKGLADLISGNEDCMTLERMDGSSDVPRWTPPETEGLELKPRSLRATVADQLAPWRVASFSYVTRRKEREKPEHDDPPPSPEPAEAPPKTFLERAGGTRFGKFLHAVFERCDFRETESKAAKDMVREELRLYSPGDAAGEEGDRNVAEVANLLGTVVSSPFPEGGFTLAQVPRESRIAEWSFYLPLAPVRAPDLRAVFERFAEGRVRDDYAPKLGRLPTEVLRGFLVGFADLVFEHGGRWFLVDWKSNRLGRRPEDFDDAGVWAAMRDEHYVLQYHLYLLGLHRFLRSRLKSYDYRSHVGGAAYAFLRGVGGGGGRGWYFDRPPTALIEALDAAVAGQRGERTAP